MKKRYVSIISLLIVWCLGWSVTAATAAYDPIVEQAQARLAELGYEPGPIDGLWGKKTETAVRSFQQDQNLPVTGKLDEETIRKLGLSTPEQPSSIVEQSDQQKPLKAAQHSQQEEQVVTAEQLESLFQKALEYYNAGNYVQAIEYCTQVIELDSSHVQAYWYRGISYGEQEEYDLATSDFRKVTELEPDLADGYGMWGGALILQGKFEEAKIPCRKAYTLAPDNIIWTMILGHTYLLTDDRGTARGYYQKAIPLITSQEELQSALVLFDVFIERGWQTEACQQEVALMKQEFSAKQQHQVQELFQQALEYHKAEQYEKAEEYYTMVIERDPTMSDAYWNRGLIYGEHQIYDLAASDFRKVTELLPDFADAYGNLAWYLFMQDKFEEAKEPYRKAIELVPENITWMMNLGHIYLFTKDRTSARTYYQKVLSLLQSEEDFTQATLLLEAFIEADVEAAAFRQELEWMRQEFDRIQHQRTQALYQQAVQYDEAGEDNKALEQYGRVLERDPDYADAYWKRGLILSQKGHSGAAITDFRRVTQLKPDFTDAYGMLGWLLLMQGRFEEARAPYQKAHDLQLEEFRWGFALGHTQLLAGDLPAARTCYQNAITLVRTEQEFQAALAILDEFIEKGWQVETCQQELIWLKQEFEKEQQRRTEALYQQALKYDEAGDAQNAIDSYTRVIQMDPSCVEAYWNRGQLYSEQKKYDAAIADVRKVLELNPDLTKTYGELGWLLIMQGNFSEAKNFCYQAHQRDPATLRWTMSLGHTFLLTGYPIMAQAYYRKVVAQVKSEEEFTQIISAFEQLIENGWQVEACRKELDWMKQAFNTRIETLFQQAKEYAEAEEYQKAIEYYIQVTKLKPDFADAHGMLGGSLLMQGKFEEATKPCYNAYKLEPKTFRWTMYMGHIALLKGKKGMARSFYNSAGGLLKSKTDYQQAISDLERFIEKGWQVEACRQQLVWIQEGFETRRQQHIEALYKQIEICSIQKDYDKMMEYYTQVIELDPVHFDKIRESPPKAQEPESENPLWILDLGHAYLLTGDVATARIYYTNALSLMQSEEEFKAFMRGFEFFIEKGWQVEACRQELAWMEQEFKIKQQIKTLYQQAEEYQNAGEYDNAIELYTKVIKLDSTHGDAHLNRGICYGEQEMFDLATVDFRKVTVLKPDFVNAYGALIVMLIKQGQFEEAKEACQKASELEPENVIWTVVLGHTYLLAGDTATARIYYEKGFLLMKSEKDFEATIVDLESFIDAGWQPENSRQTLVWMKEIFETDGYKDFIEANSHWAEAKYAQEHGDCGVALAFYQDGIEDFKAGISTRYEVYQLLGSEIDVSGLEINEERANEKPLYSKLANALHQMGYCFGELGFSAEALTYYELALGLNRKLGRDNEIAEELKSLGMVHHFLGEFLNAIGYYEEALEIFRKLNNDTETAESLRLLGRIYYEQVQYDKVLEYYEPALELSRKVDDDEKIATILNDTGVLYNDLGQHDKALEYLEQGLEVDRKLNRESDIAANLSNMGLAYTGIGKYEKALECYKQALELAQKLEMEEEIASILNNTGLAYIAWGRYNSALDYFEQALKLAKQLEWDAGSARYLKGIGLSYRQMGQYDKALGCYEKALEINRKLKIDTETVANLSSIGQIYHAWAKYDKALEYYEQALEYARGLKRDDILASTLNNIGMFYVNWEQYDEAMGYFEQALEINRKVNRELGIATDLNNMAGVYLTWNQYEKALEMYEQVLEVFSKLDREDMIATCLNNIGMVYREQGHYDKAFEYFAQSLEIHRKLGQDPMLVGTLSNIGETYYYYLKQYSDAIPYLVETVELIEKLRKTAEGDIRRDYLASQMLPYYALTLCYIHTGDFSNAYQIYEQSRARWLTEQLAGYDTDLKIPSIEHIQTELAEDTAILVYVASTAVFAITRDEYTIVELPKDEFIQNIMTDFRQRIEDALKDVKNPSQIAILRKKGEEFMTLELENTDFNKIIQYYRLLMKPKAGFRGSVIRFDNQNQGENIQQVLRTRFYQFFLGNLQEQIAGKTSLLIVPDGLLNFLPFETFMDEQDKYAAETYQISYIPSLAVLESIKERHYDPSRKPLLAFGSTVYNPQTYQGETIDTQEQFAALQRQADWLLSQENSLAELYGQLGYEIWKNLPGTLQEVVDIGNVVDDSDIFTGKQAAESTVKDLSAKGDLAHYRVLHFATHGIAVPELPELSALVLSQEEQEDGYLRIGEIAELDIKADFVNLSACETGLGKINSGEGVLGLTQAFLVAGANGLSVSLWQVADDSTARFMVELYKLVKQEGLSYANAITQVKRRFIEGEFGEQWKAPYYWAPFVYYGEN